MFTFCTNQKQLPNHLQFYANDSKNGALFPFTQNDQVNDQNAKNTMKTHKYRPVKDEKLYLLRK